MIKRWSYILLLLVPFFSIGQYGNEWIDYSQAYYKIPVVEDAIYRIDYNVLLAEIPGTAAIPSKDFQMFVRQREIPIYVSDGGNGFIDNPGEYIEFYGQKNDGWLDSLMYRNPDAIGNPFYSLINDTINYFITWSNSVSITGLRYEEETDVDFTTHSPRPYFLVNDFKDYSSSNWFYEGEKINGSAHSFYSDGKGYVKPHSNGAGGTTVDITFLMPSCYQGVDAPDVTFFGRFSSNSSSAFTGAGNHHTRIRFGNGVSSVTAIDTVYLDYKSIGFSGTFPAADVSTGFNRFYHDIIGDQGQTTDFQSFNYGAWTYPKSPDFNNELVAKFDIPFDNSLSKSYYEVSNSPGNDPILYCLGSENYRIPVVKESGLTKFLVPKNLTGSKQTMVYSDLSEVINISSLEPVNASGTFVNYLNGVNLDSLYIIVSETSLMSSAQSYASYRSTIGGGYNTLLVDVNYLYDQYGGGIEKHPLAITRFIDEIYDQSTIKPVGVFLLGKSIATVGGQGSRTNTTSFQNCLVPTYGYPSSDHLLVDGLDGNDDWTHEVPIGRISAKSNADIDLYLTKVQAYEGQQNQSSIYDRPNKAWQKQIIHFGGGVDATEQNLFAARLNNYKNTVEGSDFAGTVYTYLQQSSEPINPTVLTELNDLIANGTSLMTFYGHAVADGFDINIDDPENWNNFEKYPFVIGNSCYTGNIHLYNSSSVSEDFVFTEDAGAIGMFSSVYLGFASTLYEYTKRLYQEFSKDSYGSSIGYQAMRASAQMESVLPYALYEQTSHQMTLHCDPLIKINYHNKPEIDVVADDIFVTPEEIDLSIPTFDVNVALTNLGRSINDSVTAELVRTYPNGNGDTIFFQKIPFLHYQDTITFTVPLNPNLGIGLNEFNFRIDLPSFHDEQYDELNNNQVQHFFTINVNGIVPIYPYNYAVVPYDTVTVKASTINPIGGIQTYHFEIDTVDTYDSPEYRKFTYTDVGGVKSVAYHQWRDGLTNAIDTLYCQDSTVYFWRVAVDSTELVWDERSFQYIEGKTGWGQDHFFQFKNNVFNQVDYSRLDRERKFNVNPAQLYCQVYGYGTNINNTEWGINGQMQEYNICTWAPSLQVAVVDPNFIQAWENNSDGSNPNFAFGDVDSCRLWRREKYFTFRQSIPASMDSLQNMILNHVPDSHYVFIYAPVLAYYDDYWRPQDYAFFQSLGSTEIYDGQVNAPFITFFQKGNPASYQEVHAADSTDFIELEVHVNGSGVTGTETSPVIGPANEWYSLYWKQDSLENPSADTTRLVIEAFSTTASTSMNVLFTPNDSIINLNGIIDASLYPYIKLKAIYTDTFSTTPAQIDRWHVLYQPVPEMAIDGTNGYYFSINDSITEGESFELALDMVNISDWPMDSLKVRYYIEDQNHNLHDLPYARQDSLRVGQTFRDTVTINTFGYPGYNSIWVEANPYDVLTNVKDQPEQFHFNNLVQIPFYVRYDEINPILDVTFDGNHIINGDIVSPTSEIVITLKDENPLLVMDSDADTSKFGIYLTNPDGIQKRIPFMKNGQPNLQWIPANSSDLKFKIIYDGTFDKDGVYSLLVQGSDLSGNLSGDSEYRISFEVVSKSTITNLMNYPNPFNNSTKFVFTLTGSQVPDNMIIQILSVSGKVVREITQDELGPIKIGRNITEYAWDGRDMYGDQLANGVYLYRVITNLNGEEIEHRSSGADQYFKKGFGKMYLIR